MIKIRISNVEKYWDLGKGRSFNIDLTPGYTCLIGPNGTGKTTMLRQIRDILMRERDTESGQLPYKVLHYDNQQDGGSRNFGQWMMMGQFDKIAEVTSSSEGEGIIFNLGEFATRCGQATRECIEKHRTLIILIDGFDSGTSIDKIYQFREQFIKTIIDHCKESEVDVYIIATVNNFAMIDPCYVGYNPDCIIARTGCHKKLKTYNGFKKFILSRAK